MKTKLISASVSLAFSLALLSGIYELHQFAFYVTLVMNVIAWALLLAGQVKDEVASNIRRYPWISLPFSILSLYALIFTGHTVLAASSFMLTSLLLAVSFAKQAVNS
ncbi:hypothetical protein [Pseudomonas sp. PS02290]|uniref:hypothetical protein n=1 Tax=Pseudomonas sp. PS02290 TaxID=2991430 RepID=UPI00249BB75B|nr:hypothetical protein [Pseudomonas sp. PS02290]